MKFLIHFFERLRYLAFWGLDFLKGGKIYKSCKNISFLIEDYLNPKAIAQREDYLLSILNHAVDTTPFYNKYKIYKNINDFPVINKNTFRNNFNSFISEKYLNKKVTKVSTSGSTGAAMHVYHDKNKNLRNTSDTIYFLKQVGFKIGFKLIYLRHYDGTKRKHLRESRFKNLIKNIQEKEILGLNDQYINKLIIDIENDISNKVFMSYSSGFEQICKYLDKINFKPIQANFKSAIAISEGLNDYTRNSMNKYFNTNIVSRYSNNENGIIAQQINNNEDFVINWASYFVEILDFNKDIPSKNDTLGRIVITDLFNYAMPMIRYDTGDIGAIDYKTQPPVFKKIDGRKGDMILNTKGEIITYFIVTNLIYYKDIKQGQLIQEKEKEYTLKIYTTNKFNREKELIIEFKKFIGDDAEINIKYIDDIPVLSSGKRRLTINRYLS